MLNLKMLSSIIAASTIMAMAIYGGNNPAPVLPQKPALSPSPINQTQSLIVLSKTPETVPTTQDPIWELSLVAPSGKVLHTMKALSGRFNKQLANRHVPGNESPLPKGSYAINAHDIVRGPFDATELGTGYWVGISPLFNTGRSALGFHQDPSWGKTNSQSGTSGCIGLESAEATATLVQWIKKYNITTLAVVD